MLWLPETWSTFEDVADEYSVVSGMRVMEIEMKRGKDNPEPPEAGGDLWDTSTLYGTVNFLKKRKVQRALNREDFQVESMDNGEIYHALASHSKHCTKCHMIARQNNPDLEPQMVNGAPTVVSMDHELIMPIDAFIGKRWMDPSPTASVKNMSDHVNVSFNFAVFECEANSGRGGSVKRGVPETWPQDDIEDHRRSLYKYPVSEESARCSVAVSSMALQDQIRDSGLPVFEPGRFVKNCSQDEVIWDQDTLKPTNIDVWHRANRYRFEVARLWWKLFMDQPEEVRNAIFRNCDMAELEVGTKRDEMNDTVATAVSGTTRTLKEDSVTMILSVIELRDKGTLMTECVVPMLDNVSKEQVDSDGEETTPFEFVDAPKKTRKLGSFQPVQLALSMTWPVVMPGKTISWLDWSVNNSVMSVRNMMAYTVLEGLFGDDVASDYDELWQERDEGKINPGIRRIMDNIRPPKSEHTTAELLDIAWDATMTVFDDLVAAMPFWANAHLSMDMVNDPEARVQDLQEVNRISAELQSNSDSIEATKKLLMDELDPKQTEVTQAALRELEIECADLTYRLRKHGTDRNAADVAWLPYASRNTEFILRANADALHSETWAQEQFHRSILEISVSEEDGRIADGYSCQGNPRNASAKRIQEGSESAAACYRQWYWEVHKDNGVVVDGDDIQPTFSSISSRIEEGSIVWSKTRHEKGVVLKTGQLNLIDAHAEFDDVTVEFSGKHVVSVLPETLKLLTGAELA